MKQKPSLSFWKLWNLSFGFFGVQIAYALQNANISRIFATLGADPHSLNYFWILPPLMGILVQPLVVTLSDMVNERQKANAYSIQSFLCNAGLVVGSTSNGVNSSDWYRWDTIRRDYHEHHQIRF